jgi:hypothetical protein
VPSPTAAPIGLAGLVGLTPVRATPGQITTEWLPGQISSDSMAVVGPQLFFIVDGNTIEATAVATNGDRRTLATAPVCSGIGQIAAAGYELAYVVTTPGGPSAEAAGCPQPGTIGWSIWLLDLSGGGPRQVASGTRPASSIQVSQTPVHVALSESEYAFDLPPAAGSGSVAETVEVHSLDGRTLWTSATETPVDQVLLGGDRLAVVTEGAGSLGRVLDVWTSTAAHPGLEFRGEPASSAAISPDGSYLAWDIAPIMFPGLDPRFSMVAVVDLGSGQAAFVTAISGSLSPAPLRPAVYSTARGPLVTWFATAPDGSVYPALRYVNGESWVVPSFQEPVWMVVQNGTLYWVAASSDGWSKGVFAAGLASLGLT